MAAGGVLLTDSPLRMANVVIARSAGGDCQDNGAEIEMHTNNWIENGECATNAVNLRTGNPNLGPLADNGGPTLTHAIPSGSALVDAGEPTECPTGNDQTGLPRSNDGNADGNVECDIGAFEFVDVYAPAAGALSVRQVPFGEDPLLFEVPYVDGDGRVDASTLDDGDVEIRGPDNFLAAARFIGSRPNSQNPGELIAEYAFDPPGGSWDSSDTGTYQFFISADEIFDAAGTGANPVTPGYLSTSLTLAFPEIRVTGNGVEIQSGDDMPSSLDHTDFGDVVIGQSLTRAFTISNTGTSDLEIESTSVFGSGFVRSSDPVGTLAPGDSVAMEATFTPSAQATVTGIITLSNTDHDESTYEFAIQARGIPAPVAEIAISGNGIGIDDGDASADASDGTHFGSLRPNDTSASTFVVANQGSGALDIGDVTLDGTGFTLSRAPGVSQLPTGSTTDFEVRFLSATPGVFDAVLTLPNSDANENPYDFALRAVVAQNGAPLVDDAEFQLTNAARDGDLVGQVAAIDADGEIPATGAYEIVAGNGAGAFAIDDEGRIRVANELLLITDYELSVAVSDNEGLSGFGTISVDVNTNVLIFRDSFDR